MPNTWLLFDCHYLVHRAHHTTGFLEYKGIPTGAVFGFFGAVFRCMDKFDTANVVFCFEGDGPPVRRTIARNYKATRTYMNLTDTEKMWRDAVQKQIRAIRNDYLPDLGFKNIFYQDGYEADDIIASLCDEYFWADEQDHALIVSSDKDLYQLLNHNVSIYDPRKNEVFSDHDFYDRYPGIGPSQWPKVKALAGCKSDNVKGVYGIGEAKAIQFLQGRLKGLALSKIQCQESKDLEDINLRLVRLPFEGTKAFDFQKDDVKHSKWQELCEKLGFQPKSISFPSVYAYRGRKIV